MKALAQHPLALYAFSVVICLCIMIFVDYHLGEKAEYVNAWEMVQKLMGLETGSKESLILKKLGVTGSFLVILLINSLLGILLVQLSRLFFKLFHS
jgi:hypothetical protein